MSISRHKNAPMQRRLHTIDEATNDAHKTGALSRRPFSHPNTTTITTATTTTATLPMRNTNSNNCINNNNASPFATCHFHNHATRVQYKRLSVTRRKTLSPPLSWLKSHGIGACAAVHNPSLTCLISLSLTACLSSYLPTYFYLPTR